MHPVGAVRAQHQRLLDVMGTVGGMGEKPLAFHCVGANHQGIVRRSVGNPPVN